MSDILATALMATLADRYEIGERIASGGMADVYFARDCRRQARVALKIMRRETMGATARQRFLREIRIAGRLTHPNIVHLLDSGSVGRLLFYAMPYIEGESLGVRMARESQMRWTDVLRIETDVADALTYAHRHGVIHRDIKPSNILLDSVGRAHVTDFGIARATELADGEALTSDRFALGTLSYMSPEQVVAPSRVDARSDLYSFALLVYEALAGRSPFGADAASILVTRKAHGEREPLVAYRPELPETVDRAIARSLAPNPDERFDSVADFASALRSG